MTVEQITQKLHKNGFKVFLIGGAVRDKLLGLTPNDLDLATDATTDQIREIFGDSVKSEVGQKFGTLVLEGDVEITTFREDIGVMDNRHPLEVRFTTDFETDVKRRDFTCNGLGQNPLTNEIVDFVGGKQDIKDKKLSFIGNPQERITEDALRIMRFIRFKNRFEFSAREEDMDMLKLNIKKLKFIHINRIQSEFLKILKGDNVSQALQDLKDINFFNIFIPELDILDQIEQKSKWHEENVWEHTKMVTELLPTNLRLAGLFHDIGKLATQKWDGRRSRMTFFRHEEHSASIFLNITGRFNLKKIDVSFTHHIIENHMRVNQFMTMNRKNKVKFVYNNLDTTIDLVKFFIADSLGRVGEKKDIKNTIEEMLEIKELIENTTFANGRDVMNRFPNKQGKEIGQMIKSLNFQILSTL